MTTTLTITVELPADITPDELEDAIWDAYELVEHGDRTTAAIARAAAQALCDAYDVVPAVAAISAGGETASTAHEDVVYVRERLMLDTLVGC